MKKPIREPITAWAVYRELDGDISDTLYTSKEKTLQALRITIKEIVDKWPDPSNSFKDTVERFGLMYKPVKVQIKIIK